MGSSVIVKYNRRITVKGKNGDFDTVEIGGDVALDLREDEDPFELYSSAYSKLAEKVETELSEFAAAQPAPIRAIPQETPAAEEAAPEEEAPRMDAPIERPTGRGWVEQQIKDNTAAIHEGIASQTTLPGEKIATKEAGASGAIDEYGTPSLATIVPDEKVMYKRCRVFESVIKPASNGNLYAKVRIGKRGENGIPGQYANAQSFDAQVIKQVGANVDGETILKVREGDFVDVWGFWKPWKSDDKKFSLELQQIQVSEEQ